MRTRKANLKEKANLVKDCLTMILDGFRDMNTSDIILGWCLMIEGIKGHCEIVVEDEE
mgnify:FL=1